MDLLRALAARRTEEIVVMTMTTTLQWPLVSQHELDFDFLAFGMGHAGDFGLGLALARPERKTIVLKGDGGLLMCLGSLVTMGRYAPGNLLVLLMENRTYEMVGAQPLPPRTDFTALALPRLLTEEGPHFVVLPVSNKELLPPINHKDHAGRIRNLRKGLGIE
jgi:hypothetical protein